MEVEVNDVQSGGIGAQIGGAIINKLKDSVENIDVISLLQKLVAATEQSEDAESEVIRKKLQSVMQHYTDMSDEEKVMFATQMKEALAKKLQMQMQETPIDFSGLDEAISREIMFKLGLVAFGAFLLFVLIDRGWRAKSRLFTWCYVIPTPMDNIRRVAVFFGYKLYKSIRDKQKKQEEKKKAKQMKKKK